MLLFFWLNRASGGVTRPPRPDTAGDVATGDEIRALERAAKAARDARRTNSSERRRREQHLSDLIDKAYRRVVLREPETAAGIAAEISASDAVPEAIAAALVDNPARMDAVAHRIGEWLAEQESQRMAAENAEDDDIEALLLLIN